MNFFFDDLLGIEEIEELAKEFKAMDLNGNGSLSYHEVLEAFKELRGGNFNEKEA